MSWPQKQSSSPFDGALILLEDIVQESGQGNPLHWEDNLRVLAIWVDAQDWQHTVANAVSAAAH